MEVTDDVHTVVRLSGNQPHRIQYLWVFWGFLLLLDVEALTEECLRRMSVTLCYLTTHNRIP
ncbi:hypothetical protein BDD12DRAFT_853829 [Trichophaea hybrida]|nr:hypothetical protein BDD12DRAFT_853829 [Trichophaea hybrida]